MVYQVTSNCRLAKLSKLHVCNSQDPIRGLGVDTAFKVTKVVLRCFNVRHVIRLCIEPLYGVYATICS